jgi:hypothetical protein
MAMSKKPQKPEHVFAMLKAGGPIMRVTALGDGKAICEWTYADGTPRKRDIPLCLLFRLTPMNHAKKLPPLPTYGQGDVAPADCVSETPDRQPPEPAPMEDYDPATP